MHIAIIGAGPAGAMAAVQLARAGATVSLFDPSHPREKPCGGGLTGRALALVSDVVDIGALAPVVVHSAEVEPPLDSFGAPGRPSRRAGGSSARQAAQVALVDRGATSRSSLVVLSRAVFDRALAEAAVAAGATLIPRKAIDVRRRGAIMIVRTDRHEYEADHVLGADGVSSVVRKTFAGAFTRSQLSVAAGFFVHGITSSAITIKTTIEQPGYLWSFPRRDHLAVGICAPASHNVPASELRAQSRTWIAQHGFHGATTSTPYAWPIPSVGLGDTRRMTCSGPGWMLLGDAAGLVDPLTREGIYYALLSGLWAAEALASGSSSRAAALYAERLLTEIRPELARAARLSRLFFSPAFSGLFVDALRQSAGVREVFADLVGGIQPYRDLRRRLLATREWKLAGKAIRVAVMPSFAGTMKAVVSPQAT